ncbi:MAG: 3-oxoacyl-ACP reductase FabG [Chitinophagales bacterium]
MRLANKVAIVTGGARGIGKAIAELFAKEGATVVIWDLLDVGQETAEGIQANGGKASFQKISVTDKEQVEAAAKAVFEENGRLDILINNAGILRDKTLLKMSDDEWATSIHVNLSGVFYCTRAVVPYMQQNQYGRIVSASSTTGLRGNYGQTNYAAAKAGIIGMTKTWATELGKYGITANAIAPGYTLTEMTASIPEEISKGFIQQIPVRMAAEPIDIAYGYLYLASEEARFVSGICLPIDGGVTR